MKWVRAIFVYVLSVVLVLCLLVISLATSLDAGLTHQNKIEDWINQSNLYPSIESSIASQAQSSIENNLAGGASISKSTVQQAVQSAFSQAFLQKAVHAFLYSNYLWLEGKTTTPDFKLDISGVKQQLSTQIADEAVLTHFNNLPTCTSTQSLQLQSANPLLLSCKPAGISPQSVATQLAQELAGNSEFLSNPVITASNISFKGSSSGTAYYTRFSRVPTIYQTIQKLPWMLGGISILLLIAIVYCSRSKRSGIRRIGFVFLGAGTLLIADKVLSDVGFNRIKDSIFKGVNNNHVQQSLTSVAHNLETELVKIDLWFGIVYVAIAVILFAILITTRQRQKTKPAATDKPSKQVSTPPTRTENPALNRLRNRPSDNNLAPTPRPHQAVNAPTHKNLKKPSRPRPPRLIQ